MTNSVSEACGLLKKGARSYYTSTPGHKIGLELNRVSRTPFFIQPYLSHTTLNLYTGIYLHPE